MSLEKIRSAFQNVNSCSNWSLQLLRFTETRNGPTKYATRGITLTPSGRLAQFVQEIADAYLNSKYGKLKQFSTVDPYDGTAISTIIYKLTADNVLLCDAFQELKKGAAQPDMASNPFSFKAQAYMIQGSVNIDNEEVCVKMISMQDPITNVKHKFLHDNGSFVEINSEVLSLRTKIDLLILDDTVYMFTMAGERLFSMERAYKSICAGMVSSIEQSDIITDKEIFNNIAKHGHNPRKFVAFSESRLNHLKDINYRKKMAAQFGIPMAGGKFDTSKEGASDKLVRLLCNKGMVDPFEDLAVEVSGAKKWQ